MVEEGVAGDLARGGTGDAGDGVELVRGLEVREVGPAGCEELGGGGQSVGAGDEEGHRDFAEYGVRLSGDGGVRDAGHGTQDVLDLGGVDVLAAADDEFLQTAADGEVARRGAAGQVAGPVPAVGEDFGGGLGPVVVAGHHVGALDPDLALGAGCAVPSGAGIDESYVEAGDGRAAGALDAGAGGGVHGDGAAGLGAAVEVEQRYAVRGFEGRLERDGRDRPGDQAGAQAGAAEGLSVGGVDEVLVEGGDAGEEGGGLLAYGGRDVLGREAVEDAGGGADRGHADDARDVGEAVEERERPDDPGLGGESRDRRVRGGDGPQGAPLGGKYALGFAGGAGGVQLPGDVVQAEGVPGGGGGFGGGERLVADGAGARCGVREGGVRHDDEDGLRVSGAPGAPDPGDVCGVGDDGAGAAVGEDVGELGVGGVRVDGDAHGRGADRRKIALDGLDPVAEQDHDAVPGFQSEGRQVSGDPAGALLQAGVRDGPARVAECLLPAGPFGVLPKNFREWADQLGTQHVTISVSRFGPSWPSHTERRTPARSVADSVIRPGTGLNPCHPLCCPCGFIPRTSIRRSAGNPASGPPTLRANSVRAASCRGPKSKSSPLR